MNIFSQGRNGKKQQFAQGLACMMAKELNIMSSKKDLTVVLEKILGSHGMNGVTAHSEEHGIIIVIDPSLKEERFMLTLAHEMIHAKQIARGTMKIIDRDTTIWRGKTFINADHHYLDTPWELEAFKMQELLVRRIASSLQ